MQRGQNQALLSGVLCQDKKQWAPSRTQEALWKQEALLYCVSDGALAQVAQRGYEVSSLEISKSYLDMVLGTLLWISLLRHKCRIDPWNLHQKQVVYILVLFLCQHSSQNYCWLPCRDFHDGYHDLLYILWLVIIRNRLIFSAFSEFWVKSNLPSLKQCVCTTYGRIC